MPNILETKVRCDNLPAVRQRLLAARATRRAVIDQHDTYFCVPSGWLKLRVARGDAQLVAYRRYDGAIRSCSYLCLNVDSPDECRRALDEVLGILVDVEKTREQWSFGGTEVHLDNVRALGEFVELETKADSFWAADLTHQRCLDQLQLAHRADIDVSYANLLLERVGN